MDFLKQTFREFSKNNCSTLAAALAYYTAFALPPLLFLLLTILTLGLSVMYDGEEARAEAQNVLTSQAAQMLGNEEASEQISTILKSSDQATGKWWKTLLSFAGIVAGATGVVAALQAALNQVWEVQPDPDSSGWKDLLTKRLLSLAMILGLGFLLLVSLVVSSVLAALGGRVGELLGLSETFASGINFGVQGVVVFVIFAAIFKFMPDAEVRWRDVLVGAVITTALFLAGRYALELYFSYSEPGAHLGAAAASLAVLLAWVYYTAMIVLLGAEATQVYAVRYGNGVRPQTGSVRVVKVIKRGDVSDKSGQPGSSPDR
ncbi:YihY/virulence factor BrkB family protein [Aporhodopirellula aestuarii]|uniref:YihY/virulence factor BrkB family protein n=1 Tax=Aporhodopirellula aestuarii TaxID=2950107 RepID=A0ABT0TYV2_9BACT|nr:YihY/virulence factor BrkB family protein [Aporhodopirellula aestuarii]MCM2369772.1 YihY/virulence factor BrkB family protein [Aporhodopirellula aestuarii]